MSLTIETKEQLLLRPSLRVKDIMEYTGYSKSKCYSLMKICREEFNGKAGLLTDAITPKSLCLALGTSLEEELRLVGVAKGIIKA